MSTDITLFSNGNKIPAYLIDDGASAVTSTLAGGGDTRRISIKGSVFRMLVGGQELAVNEDRSMNFIVVGAAPAFARTYYDEEFVDGVDVMPVCWSDDGRSPSDKAITPQATSCATCPQNIKGSGKNNSRACRYSARLAVVLEGDIEGGVYGISIPATSIFGEASGRYSSLQEYARKLAGFKIAIEKVVTEFKFDTKSPVPKLMFQAVRPVTQGELDAVKSVISLEDMGDHVGPREFEDRSKGKPVSGTPYASGDDEDEDEAPPKKKRAARPVEDDEDEDEAPPKKKRAARPVEDDEDEDEAPPKKKRAARPVDDEDEDEAPPKKRKSSKPASLFDEKENGEDDELSSLVDEWADD